MRSRRNHGLCWRGPRPWTVLALAGVLSSVLNPHEGRAQFARAPVVGMVVDSLGGPIVGAQIDIEGTFHRTTTDSAGRFRLIEVEAGRLRLNVRRLGFLPATLFLNLTASGARQVMVTMSAAPEVLAPVVVSDRREVYDARLSGFESRAAKRRGGHFITRERIQRTNSKRLSDLLRQVPTVRIATVRGIGTTAYIRGANCPALVYVDGSPASAGPLDLDLIDLVSVDGIEVYGGFGAPPEFSNARADRCGVIAIWSRPFRPRERSADEPARPSMIASLLAMELVFSPEAVDSVAAPIPGSIRTVYPDSLFRAQVGGNATLRFVVDTTGLVEMTTLEVDATHQLFAQAARAALTEARFSPAVLGGRRVRQVVALPFRFAPPGETGLPR
jgi:TonB family protein